MKANESEPNPEKPNFTLSAETQRIIKILIEVDVGAVITYDEIILAAGGNVAHGITPLRGALYTAFRNLQREKNFVFGTITGVGIKRLADSEILPHTRHKMDIIRRNARRTSHTLACADFMKLTNAQRQQASCLQAQIGAIQLASSIKAAHQIEQKILQGKQLEVGNVISFFKEVA